jgi:hypothetical protein
LGAGGREFESLLPDQYIYSDIWQEVLKVNPTNFTQETRREFWAEFEKFLSGNISWSEKKAKGYSRYGHVRLFDSGRNQICFSTGALFKPTEKNPDDPDSNELRVELCVESASSINIDNLEPQLLTRIRDGLGQEGHITGEEEKRRKIQIYKSADLSIKEDWPSHFQWLLDNLKIMNKVFYSIILPGIKTRTD